MEQKQPAIGEDVTALMPAVGEDVSALFNDAPKTPPGASTQPPAQVQDRGFLRGLMDTLPTPSNIFAGVQQIPANIRQSLSGEWANVDRTQTPIGKVLNNRPREGAGELAGILGQLGLTAAPGFIRTRAGGTPAGFDRYMPNTGGAKPVARPTATQSVPYASPPPPPKRQGRLRTTTPAAEPPPVQVDTTSLPASWKPFAEGVRPSQTTAASPAHASPTAPAISQPTRFSSDLQGQPAPFGQIDDVGFGGTPGTPEAGRQAFMHRYDAETVNRYRHMLENDRGAISPDLLRMMGGPVGRYGMGAVAAKGMGLPGWAGAAGVGAMDLGKLIRAHPEASARMLRGALLANLAVNEP